jgi:hypothetical protein
VVLQGGLAVRFLDVLLPRRRLHPQHPVVVNPLALLQRQPRLAQQLAQPGVPLLHLPHLLQVAHSVLKVLQRLVRLLGAGGG